MDRAAKLAEVASLHLPYLESSTDQAYAMKVVRNCIGDVALLLGFAPNEISAAIDQALTDAGVGR